MRSRSESEVNGKSASIHGHSWGRARKHKRLEKPRPSTHGHDQKSGVHEREGVPSVASAKFTGDRRGYEFKAGVLGMGYYKQRPAESAVL